MERGQHPVSYGNGSGNWYVSRTAALAMRSVRVNRYRTCGAAIADVRPRLNSEEALLFGSVKTEGGLRFLILVRTEVPERSVRPGPKDKQMPPWRSGFVSNVRRQQVTAKDCAYPQPRRTSSGMNPARAASRAGFFINEWPIGP
jgi:hypothetical protein